MDVYIDLIAHITASFLTGYFCSQYFFPKKRTYLSLSLVTAFISGLFIDIDHLFDYFLAFGPHFNFFEFMQNKQFEVTHKTIIPLHAFEYVIVSLIILFFFKRKKLKMIIASFTISMFLHLLIDMSFFSLPPQFYFITYRIAHGFMNLK